MPTGSSQGCWKGRGSGGRQRWCLSFESLKLAVCTHLETACSISLHLAKGELNPCWVGRRKEPPTSAPREPQEQAAPEAGMGTWGWAKPDLIVF